MALRVGERCNSKGGRGTVRWIGEFSHAGCQAGRYVGIEMDTKAPARNDGTLKGVRYFACMPGHGVFLREAAVAPLFSERENAQPPPPKRQETATNSAAAAAVAPQQQQQQQLQTPAMFFAQYAAAAGDAMEVDGLIRMCGDLGVAPESATMLLLCWQCGCKSNARLERRELLAGIARLGFSTAVSAALLRDRLGAVEKQVAGSDRLFAELYSFAFGLAKESPEHRVIDSAMAADMLQVVQSVAPRAFRACKHVPRFAAFLRARKGKAVNSDVWHCFLDFAAKVAPNFSNYDTAAACAHKFFSLSIFSHIILFSLFFFDSALDI